MMTAGAIGAIAADKYEPSKYRAGLNLQFGMVAAQADDAFLMASDGLWDTLDPVQVRLFDCVSVVQAASLCQLATPGSYTASEPCIRHPCKQRRCRPLSLRLSDTHPWCTCSGGSLSGCRQ